MSNSKSKIKRKQRKLKNSILKSRILKITSRDSNSKSRILKIISSKDTIELTLN